MAEETKELHDGLKALGAGGTNYEFGIGHAPDPSVLERFPNPQLTHDPKGGHVQVDIIAPEFTTLCPKTGQPDFAAIEITYVPNQWCIESKSLKLYLMQFRMHGEFHEACVNRIGSDLVGLLDPIRLVVIGKFTARGGIKFWPNYQYTKQQIIASGSPTLLGG